MHSGSLCCFLAISCLAVATVLCQDVVANCHERIEECKKVAFDEDDPVKRGDAQAKCFSSFLCESMEDSIRQDLKKRASARSEAIKWKARGGFQPRRSSIAPSIKATFEVIAACLFAEVVVTHCLKNPRRCRPYWRPSQESIAPVNKVNSMFVAACLFTVLGLGHF